MSTWDDYLALSSRPHTLQELNDLLGCGSAFQNIPREPLTGERLQQGTRYLVPSLCNGWVHARYTSQGPGLNGGRVYWFTFEGSSDSVGIGEKAVPQAVWEIDRRYQVVDTPRPARKPKPNKGPQPRGQHWSK